MQNTTRLELVEIFQEGREESNRQDGIKTPKKSNTTILRKQGESKNGDVKETIMEIKQMIRNMEAVVMKRMEVMEKKIDTIAKQREHEMRKRKSF